MLITILLNALIISLYTTGIYIATDDNMILNPLKNWLDKKLINVRYTFIKGKRIYPDNAELTHYKIYNPLIGCPYCMPSFHGAYIFLLLNWNELTPIYFLYYIIAFTCATGLNSITVSMYNK